MLPPAPLHASVGKKRLLTPSFAWCRWGVVDFLLGVGVGDAGCGYCWGVVVVGGRGCCV